jgi:hypothetical protein
MDPPHDHAARPHAPPSTPTARSPLPDAPPILHPGVVAMNSLIKALLNLQDAAYGACDALASKEGTEKKQ